MSIESIATKYGISTELATTLLEGLRRTGGRQVQFSHPDLGGMGQWMPGMVMVGRMGDSTLKAKVDALCHELLSFLKENPSPPEKPTVANVTSFANSANSAGSQNGIQYAYYAADNRLVITSADGDATTYDVTGHRITEVAQAQASGTASTLRFTTADGSVVDIANLKRIA